MFMKIPSWQCTEKDTKIKLRQKKKISQEELAARMQVAGIDIDQRTISRIELEKRFLADFEMREIARILQISLDELAER